MPFSLDTSTGSGGTLEPTQDPLTGEAQPRAKAPVRLRSISGVTLQRPFRQERVEADYAATQTGAGGAIISTRDSVSLGFGLEQIPTTGVRNELVRRMMAYLLPTGADTVAPTLSWLRPDEGATVNAADPVEIEVEGVDERGDMKEVRLSVGGQLVQRKVSFPFQMRWYPTADDIGDTVTLSVEAEDKAGNVTTSTRSITVGPANGVAEAPLFTGVTTVAGEPVVGQALTCVPSGREGGGDLSYAWLRNGVAISGASADSYTLVAADVGRGVACRVTATNGAGNADSTSEAVTVSAAGGTPGPQGPAGPPGQDGEDGTTAERRDRSRRSEGPRGSRRSARSARQPRSAWPRRRHRGDLPPREPGPRHPLSRPLGQQRPQHGTRVDPARGLEEGGARQGRQDGPRRSQGQPQGRPQGQGDRPLPARRLHGPRRGAARQDGQGEGRPLTA